eukprot:jgi/Mesvir1/2007/Mv06193-RA.1
MDKLVPAIGAAIVGILVGRQQGKGGAKGHREVPSGHVGDTWESSGLKTLPNLEKPIELYSIATPNGQKVGICLEEMGLSYNANLINIMKSEQLTPEFLKISPNNKIPAIVNPNTPSGEPLSIFESGAIMIHLADITGKFLPRDKEKRYTTLQWLFWQVGGVGPMFGQFGVYFKYARGICTDPYPLERTTKEVKRLLGVLDRALEGKEYVAGDYSIADMAIFPWVEALDIAYGARDHLELDRFHNVMSWRARVKARPAVQRGLAVNPFPKNTPS